MMSVAFLAFLASLLLISCVQAWRQPLLLSGLVKASGRASCTRCMDSPTGLATAGQTSVKLESGESDGELCRLEVIDETLSKYRVKGLVKAGKMKEFLREYENEMKSRGVAMPGFRPGKLPPSAMADVRRYLASYAVELTIGDLCNINDIIVVDEDRQELNLVEDTFKKIVLADSQGRSYEAQRDSWKEGKDFGFTAEFFGKPVVAEDEEEEEGGLDLMQTVDVDAEVVDVKE